jgi:hypothetical protein
MHCACSRRANTAHGSCEKNKKAARKPPLENPNHAYSIFTLSTCIESPLTEPVAAM